VEKDAHLHDLGRNRSSLGKERDLISVPSFFLEVINVDRNLYSLKIYRNPSKFLNFLFSKIYIVLMMSFSLNPEPNRRVVSPVITRTDIRSRCHTQGDERKVAHVQIKTKWVWVGLLKKKGSKHNILKNYCRSPKNSSNLEVGYFQLILSIWERKVLPMNLKRRV
jgi:hypothetical protein